jgi:hypothetical protein
MTSEFQSRNAWFIYTLTFLLTLAVFFILLLILIKCIQLCVEMKRMLWKKFKRRQRRRRRRARRRRERVQQATGNSPATRNSSCEDSSSSYSSSTSYSSSSASSYSSPSSSSSSSEDEALTSHPPHFQVNSSSSCYENMAFQPDLVTKNECSKKNRNLINRKYDCKSRFVSKCPSSVKEPNEICDENTIQTISSQVEKQIGKNLSCAHGIQIDSSLSAFDLNQIVILSNEMSVQNAFPSPPPFNSIIPHTTGGILFSSSAHSCTIHHFPQLTYLSAASPGQINKNFDISTGSPLLLNKKCAEDLQSVKISLEDDEIPPSYDQVIKESQV